MPPNFLPFPGIRRPVVRGACEWTETHVLRRWPNRNTGPLLGWDGGRYDWSFLWLFSGRRSLCCGGRIVRFRTRWTTGNATSAGDLRSSTTKFVSNDNYFWRLLYLFDHHEIMPSKACRILVEGSHHYSYQKQKIYLSTHRFENSNSWTPSVLLLIWQIQVPLFYNDAKKFDFFLKKSDFLRKIIRSTNKSLINQIHNFVSKPFKSVTVFWCFFKILTLCFSSGEKYEGPLRELAQSKLWDYLVSTVAIWSGPNISGSNWLTQVQTSYLWFRPVITVSSRYL